jgi:uncharacterized cupredoxin-like copper-binding protein
MKTLFLSIALVTATFVGHAYAHGDERHEKKMPAVAAKAEQKAFGIAGDPKKTSRTITFSMQDAMRFDPSSITVKRGETIKFVVQNHGKIMHEMVIGTMKELKEHADLMKKFPGMEHDEPYMAHVKPGGAEEIIWQFNRPGEFNFACLVAGHFEAGMMGKITVR